MVDDMVPVHPEPGPGGDQELRWVTPASILGFVGAAVRVPPGVQALFDDATVESVFVEPAAVVVRLCPGRGWRREGARVRTALQVGLAHREQWRAAEAGSPGDGDGGGAGGGR